MEPLQVAEILREKYPDEIIDTSEFRGQVSVTIKKEKALDIFRFLHDDPSLSFDYLSDLCGLDNLGKKDSRFAVVYHLYSMEHRHMIRIKVAVSEDDCAVDSVVPVWIGADWHERECYDMFGIEFKGHPDLRRILMPEDWEGHPLRKDYPAKGPSDELEWPGFREVLEKSKEFKKYEWKR
ncbi:MAG: NADH-quinone oxidoreductase subunit C [Nitrospirota bacterium]|nr:MAG: NADH-quinone oxidoreductase subunit C [Nitrospirota bacterium]